MDTKPKGKKAVEQTAYMTLQGFAMNRCRQCSVFNTAGHAHSSWAGRRSLAETTSHIVWAEF